MLKTPPISVNELFLIFDFDSNDSEEPEIELTISLVMEFSTTLSEA